MKTLFRFALVGGLGFLVDAGVLQLLLSLTHLGPFLARAVAIAAAMLVTWQCNRLFTFGASGRGLVSEGLRYGSVGIASACVNYAVYSALILAIPSLPPVAALVLASISALSLSFMGYSRVVFRS